VGRNAASAAALNQRVRWVRSFDFVHDFGFVRCSPTLTELFRHVEELIGGQSEIRVEPALGSSRPIRCARTAKPADGTLYINDLRSTRIYRVR
jgi:hypothetical protein